MTRNRLAQQWYDAVMPSMAGKLAAITGPTSGIGGVTALALAQAGAELVLAARSPQRLDQTVSWIESMVPTAIVHPVVMDMSDQSSIRAGAKEIAAAGPIDVLVHNAGVMGIPFATTAEGYELQFATNYLGPFLLTGLLLEHLADAPGSRIVMVASQAHRFPRTPPLRDPTDHSRRYFPMGAYGATKLAALMFTFELAERLEAAGSSVLSVAAHPGYANTGLMRKAGGLRGWLLANISQYFGQTAALGALPTLYASAADLPTGSYIGPHRMLQLFGLPCQVQPRSMVRDREARQELWRLSQAATGIIFLDD